MESPSSDKFLNAKLDHKKWISRRRVVLQVDCVGKDKIVSPKMELICGYWLVDSPSSSTLMKQRTYYCEVENCKMKRQVCG